ncbi:MAG: tetratricopeptide repeat-containing protein kinase family protein, partial [Verrucomicrobiota bacterium]
GHGCSGEVYHAVHEKTGDEVAIKRYNSMSIDRAFVESNIKRGQAMKDPVGCVVPTESRFDGTPYYTVSPWIGTSKLEKVEIKKEEDLWKVIINLAKSLGQAHKYGFIHGNLHPGNIFVPRSKEQSDLMITDFGCGMIGELHHVDLADKAFFAPPEQLECMGKDLWDGAAERWDVYRFGAVAFWLLNRQFPRAKKYMREHETALKQSGGRPVGIDPLAIAAEARTQPKLVWKKAIGRSGKFAEFRALIDRCLSIDPSERPVDMREVRNSFKQIRHVYHVKDIRATADAEVRDAENRVVMERLKQKTKLFTVRAVATILAISFILATYLFVSYMRESSFLKGQVSELDSVVTNQREHIGELDDRWEDTVVDLQQSRNAADSFFSKMAQGGTGSSVTQATELKQLEESREYYSELVSEFPSGDESLEKGRALHSLSLIESQLGRLDEASDHCADAIRVFEGVLKDSDSLEPEQLIDTLARTANCYRSEAVNHRDPTSQEALDAVNRSVWYYDKALEQAPDRVDLQLSQAEVCQYFGELLGTHGKHAEAVAAFSNAEIVKIADQVNLDQHPELLESLSSLQFEMAKALKQAERNSEAVDAHIAADSF